MSKFLEGLNENTNVATTLNGAKVYRTTQSDVLDMFSLGGAYRSRSDKDIIVLFDKALSENKLLALRTLFYLRDVRGNGQGERRFFRVCLSHLAKVEKEWLVANLDKIPEYGRYDDLFVLLDTQIQNEVMEFIANQLLDDMENDKISLLVKWMPSENTSSLKTRRLATKIRKKLGLTPRDYRKTLSALRKKLRLVEADMSRKQWNRVQYDKLPSKAGMKYRKAFMRNDNDRYGEFLESLKNGKKKINVKTLYPYEIVEKVNLYAYEYRYNTQEEILLNGMWDNLPDYIQGDMTNALAVVDTSGSMYGTPLNVALSLGLYLAERNKGEFNNHFITFSSTPKLVKVSGSTFCDKIRNMSRANWQNSTNIEATFDLILNVAKTKSLSQDEMPKTLIIISDMQFDSCASMNGKRVSSKDKYLFDVIRKRFEDAGYKLPKLVFWNVNGMVDNFPMKENENGLGLVSGLSPSIFKSVLGGEYKTPYDLMLEIINNERYSAIAI